MNAPLGVGQGLVILALRAPRPAPEVMGKSVTRTQADRLGEVGDGLVPILPVVPEQAAPVIGPRVLGIKADGFAEVGDGRVEPRRYLNLAGRARACDDQQVNERGRRDQAGGWSVAVHIPLGLDGGPHEVREKMRVLAEHHRAERGHGPFSGGEHPPHPPFGHLLPGGEKGTVPAPAERVDCRGESERTPSPHRGEGRGQGVRAWRRARSLGISFGLARDPPREEFLGLINRDDVDVRGPARRTSLVLGDEFQPRAIDPFHAVDVDAPSTPLFILPVVAEAESRGLLHDSLAQPVAPAFAGSGACASARDVASIATTTPIAAASRQDMDEAPTNAREIIDRTIGFYIIAMTRANGDAHRHGPSPSAPRASRRACSAALNAYWLNRRSQLLFHPAEVLERGVALAILHGLQAEVTTGLARWPPSTAAASNPASSSSPRRCRMIG